MTIEIPKVMFDVILRNLEVMWQVAIENSKHTEANEILATMNELKNQRRLLGDPN